MKPATESSSTPAAPRRGAWVPQALIWVGIALAAVMSGVFLYRAATGYLLDVGVFRDAGRAFAEGWGLYGEDFPSRSGFAFLYPPFAALLFVPLTWGGETAMQVLWTIATIAAIYAILAMAATRLGARRPAFIAAGLSGPALAIEPIVSHMFFGQINVFLMLLVAVDVLGFTPHRLRGVGIGVAAGIKITPAAYAIVYLVRRDWGGVWRSAGAFFVTALIGAATAPEQAWRFWTEEFFILDRAGGPGRPRASRMHSGPQLDLRRVPSGRCRRRQARTTPNVAARPKQGQNRSACQCPWKRALAICARKVAGMM